MNEQAHEQERKSKHTDETNNFLCFHPRPPNETGGTRPAQAHPTHKQAHLLQDLGVTEEDPACSASMAFCLVFVKKKKKKSVEYIFLAVKKMADGPANGPAHPGPVRCTVLFSWAVDRVVSIFPM